MTIRVRVIAMVDKDDHVLVLVERLDKECYGELRLEWEDDQPYIGECIDTLEHMWTDEDDGEVVELPKKKLLN